MKKNILKYFSIATVILFVVSCSKNNSITNQPYLSYGVSGKSLLKINFASAYAGNPTVLLKVNNLAVSNLITARTPFPGGGYNTNGSNYALYLSVPLGTNSVSVVRPKVGTDVDSIVLFSTVLTMTDTMAYTLHIADTLVNSSSNLTKSLLVKNDISDLDTGYARFRFVNLMPNVPALDLYLNGMLIKSNIGYLQASDTFGVKTGINAPNYATFATPTWVIRPAGALPTSTALATYASVNALQSRQVFTVFAMGYSGATGSRLPYVSFTLDKNQ
ncbi:DUF4397 domain-containing protein [Parasediminibacterium paludis]|uniref:DUF4397 domain-containing protein n=1 Tax=Parasediminibacterium paludis TaxID=908966 RepID=A0ABV8PQB9_9BACT